MRTTSLLGILFLLSGPCSLLAQRAILFYDHTPDNLTLTARVTHLLPDERVDTTTLQPRLVGLRPVFEVEEGGSVCFQIEHANLVLYTYSTKAEELKVDLPEDWMTVVRAVSDQMGLIRISSPPGTPSTPDESKLIDYMLAVERLHARQLSMMQTRARSDSIASFETSHEEISFDFDLATVESAEADSAYGKLEHASPMIHGAVEMLRALQLDIWEEIKALKKDFDQAAMRGREPICEAIHDQPVRLTLVIRPRAGTSKTTMSRPTGEILTVDVHPISNSWFALSYGVMVGTSFEDHTRFSLDEGVVRAEEENKPIFAPGLFAQARAPNTSWLWGTVGASIGEKGLRGLFLGLSGRFGRLLGGPSMSLGVGLAMFEVPVALKSGEIGAPLPQGVENLDKVLEEELRSGIGIHLAITGLELGNKKTKN